MARAHDPGDTPLVLIGTGGHAVSIGGIIRSCGLTVALCVDKAKAGQTFLGARVAADLADGFAPDRHCLVLAIGDNAIRETVAADIVARYPAARFATLIHADASVADDSVVGDGTVVMPGAIVGPATTIGRGCIVNTRASIDHDCVIADFASLAPGAVTGGTVRIGARSAISIGASIRHGVTIGADAVLGGGSYLHRDLPDGVVAYGVPARIERSRSRGDRYL